MKEPELVSSFERKKVILYIYIYIYIYMEPLECNNTSSLETKNQQGSLKGQNFHSLEPLELKNTC